SFFFFTATATTETYPLSLHDALPILHVAPEAVIHAHHHDPLGALTGGDDPFDSGGGEGQRPFAQHVHAGGKCHGDMHFVKMIRRSEEHTSELQSRGHLVCRLLLEKKK